jgi:hypothetical protein
MKIIIIITYYHPKRYQVFTPSLHEVQGSHTNISDKVYNQVSIRQPPPPPRPRPFALLSLGPMTAATRLGMRVYAA